LVGQVGSKVKAQKERKNGKLVGERGSGVVYFFLSKGVFLRPKVLHVFSAAAAGMPEIVTGSLEPLSGA